MKQLALHQSLIVAVAAVVFFVNLGVPRLWDRDEPRNAGCAAEMIERGDWVVPVFKGELRTHKPVLLYWLMMSAYSVFGVNELGARFWSAVLGIGTALVTYHIGRRLFNVQVGLWAAVILSTSFMFDVAARAATPDSVLIFFATCAVLAFVRGTMRPPSAADPELAAGDFRLPCPCALSWPTVLVASVMMGLAVLAKGPVGLVLPTAVIGMFLLIVRLPPASQPGVDDRPAPIRFMRRLVGCLRPFAPLHFLRTCWAMRPVTTIAVASAVALPWYLWVGFRTDGAWLSGFFLEHNVQRALAPMEGHGGSLLYYPVAIMIGFFPWSVFLGPMLIDLVRRVRRTDRWHVGYTLVACWVGVYVGLFSLASTKLPNYVTPAYPALALMAGCFVYHWCGGVALVGRIWPRMALGCLALAGVALIVVLPLAARQFLPGDELLGAIGLVPLVGAIACFLLAERGRVPAAAVTFAGVAIVFSVALFGFVAVRVDRHQHNDVLLSAIATHSAGSPRVAALGCFEPSWVFYGGRPIEFFPDAKQAEASAFLNAGDSAYVITTEDRYRRLRSRLPEDVSVLARTSYFLKKGKLVVVGRSGGIERTATKPRGEGDLQPLRAVADDTSKRPAARRSFD